VFDRSWRKTIKYVLTKEVSLERNSSLLQKKRYQPSHITQIIQCRWLVTFYYLLLSSFNHRTDWDELCWWVLPLSGGAVLPIFSQSCRVHVTHVNMMGGPPIRSKDTKMTWTRSLRLRVRKHAGSRNAPVFSVSFFIDVLDSFMWGMSKSPIYHYIKCD